MAMNNRNVRVKICGITNPEDAQAAVRAGAHALGFVFHAPSPRYVTPEKAAAIIAALPPFVAAVGVFVNRPREEVESIAVRSGVHAIQLHGNELPEDCIGFGRPIIKSFRVSREKPFPVLARYRVSGVLLDSGFGGAWGGTGVPLDWNYLVEHLNTLAQTVRSRLVLAGGLDPENVGQAIHLVQPSAVDVSSGVEDEPGKKNEHLIKEFIHAVRTAGHEKTLA